MRLSNLLKQARKARKQRLINAGLLDDGDTAIDIFNSKGENWGETHRRYMHPTRGMRVINNTRDVVSGMNRQTMFNVFEHTITQARNYV